MLIGLPNLPLLFQDVRWTPIVPQQKNRSEFTGRTQVIGTPGTETWEGTAVVLPPASTAELWLWEAFLASCRGCENTFHLPARALPQYSGPEPTVEAAIAGNRGVTLSSTANVSLGMYATVEQADAYFRMVKIVGIEGFDVHFEPYLITDPEIDATFTIGEPFCPVRMAQPRLPMPAMHEGFAFDFEEALIREEAP